QPMELLGAPVVGVFAPLPVVEGVQLAHVVVSTGGRMCLTAVSHRGLMPDMSRYVECLQNALEQLAVASSATPRLAVG
ncbi:MAG: WS/DGAT domain-containing protein, partial [Rhodococcus sp. (in: high G+C Gram-positive bacteria)]